MLKRSCALLFILLFAFSSTAFGAGVATKALPINGKRTGIPKPVLKPTVDPNKKVRVIVELKSAPSITYATKKGVKFSELSPATKKSLEQNALEKQDDVKSQMSKKSVDARYINSFTTVVNGFSAEVKYKDIDQIKQIQEVQKVYIANEYKRPTEKPEMKYSKELVQAQEAWKSSGYKGEGMVVGIIDTGIDSTHRDMVLSKDTQPKLTQDKVSQIVSANKLPGKYYTSKVPYGYNYMDHNSEIRDLGADATMHGMHVSGIVAANGDEENGGIKGIAPEAQLLALKVFGNNPEMPSTFGDIYVKALDDAIKLGADVVNMSLGSAAGFVAPDDPEQQAVTRAVDNGVLMSISAGNDAFLGNSKYVFGQNPDYGVNGSPGLSTDSLEVASYENSFMDMDDLQYNAGGDTGTAVYLSAGSAKPNDFVQKSFKVVAAGIGTPDDFKGKDFTGKFALVQRGTINFVDKALNAQAAGAEGVIIYNNADGVVNMATDPRITIPQLFMLKNDGDKLRAALDGEKDVTITFNGEKQKTANPNAGKMSDFSSWGLTPDLDFKPDITAPGGQILSTLNNNSYGVMSGTSMAAPHVSGGAAIVLERVDKEFNLKNRDRVQRAKNLLMNTANPVLFGGTFVSPRRQGSGLMQINNALTTPAIVTNTTSNEAKVALKQINGNTATFQLKAQNFSDKAVKYEVQANAQTDNPEDKGITVVEPNTAAAKDLGGIATVNGSDKTTIDVPAKGTTTFSVTVDLTSVDKELASKFVNGYWVEGFVTLKDPTDTNPDLHVPYSGFKGGWDKAPILDKPNWDADTFYGLTGLGTSVGSDFDFIGQDYQAESKDPGNLYLDPNRDAFSPNEDGYQDNVIPILSFLRNAKQVKFNVLDKDKHVIRTLRTEDLVYKNYDSANPYTFDPDWGWDGTVKGKPVAEGQYYFQVQSVIDYPGAKWQTVNFPVKVDNTAPTLDASFNPATQTVTAHAADNKNGSGIAYWDVLVDGKSVTNGAYLSDKTTSFQLTKKLSSDQELTVAAVDNAGNAAFKEASAAVDKTNPEVHMLTPQYLGVSGSKDVKVTGYITDKSGVKSFQVNGKAVKLSYDSANDQYLFNTTVHYAKDGVYDIQATAVDGAGNKGEISQKFLLDSTAPKVSLSDAHYVKSYVNSINLSVRISDAFDGVRVYLDDDEIYHHNLSSPYKVTNFKKTISAELKLASGHNVHTVKVVDAAGHATTETFDVYKTSRSPKNYKDVSRSHWAFEEINTLSVMGILTGGTSTMFEPTKDVTRLDAAKMIVRAMGLSTNNRPAPKYSDISKLKKSDPEGYKAIAALADEGLLTGSKGKFNPNGSLTRGEMAKLLVQSFELEGTASHTYKDVKKSSPFAPYASVAVSNHLMNPYKDGSFNVNKKVTRADFALYLARVLDDRFK